MCVDHVVVRDMDTKACTDFAAHGAWLGAVPPAPVSVAAPIAPTDSAGKAADPAPAGSAATSQALRLLPAGFAAFTFTAR